MKNVAKAAVYLLATTGVLALSGCESSGSNRVASVGALPGAPSSDGTTSSGGSGTGDTGSGSTAGDTGASGAGSGSTGTGSTGTGSTGTGSTDTGSTGTGSTGTTAGGTSITSGGSGGSLTGQSLSTLPVPGLVGADGAANTGLLANTGDPNNPGVLGPVLVTAGNAVLGVTGQTPTLVSAVDSTVPGSVAIAGTVQKVLTDTGQALVDTGNGKAYLVDGLTAAVG